MPQTLIKKMFEYTATALVIIKIISFVINARKFIRDYKIKTHENCSLEYVESVLKKTRYLFIEQITVKYMMKLVKDGMVRIYGYYERNNRYFGLIDGMTEREVHLIVKLDDDGDDTPVGEVYECPLSGALSTDLKVIEKQLPIQFMLKYMGDVITLMKFVFLLMCIYF